MIWAGMCSAAGVTVADVGLSPRRWDDDVRHYRRPEWRRNLLRESDRACLMHYIELGRTFSQMGRPAEARGHHQGPGDGEYREG
jgi:hypothetical protein